MRGVYIVKSMIVYYVYYYFYGLFYDDASTNRRTCSEPEVMATLPRMQSTGSNHHHYVSPLVISMLVSPWSHISESMTIETRGP